MWWGVLAIGASLLLFTAYVSWLFRRQVKQMMEADEQAFQKRRAEIQAQIDSGARRI